MHKFMFNFNYNIYQACCKSIFLKSDLVYLCCNILYYLNKGVLQAHSGVPYMHFNSLLSVSGNSFESDLLFSYYF